MFKDFRFFLRSLSCMGNSGRLIGIISPKFRRNPPQWHRVIFKQPICYKLRVPKFSMLELKHKQFELQNIASSEMSWQSLDPYCRLKTDMSKSTVKNISSYKLFTRPYKPSGCSARPSHGLGQVLLKFYSTSPILSDLIWPSISRPAVGGGKHARNLY